MNEMIISTGYDGKKWLLIEDATQRSVKRLAAYPDFRGDVSLVSGGCAPQKPSSTGRVYVQGGREFYPSVFGFRWIRA